MQENVVSFPPLATMQPDQALASIEQLELKEVLIIGYDKNGNFVSRSSGMTKRDALWLIELTKSDPLG